VSIYEACDKVGSALAAVSAPQTPDEVRVLPPGHEDDRHAKRNANVWINVIGLDEAYEDENSASYLVVYSIGWSAWFAKTTQTLTQAAQQLGTLGDACAAALAHNDFSGWARHGVKREDISVKYETMAETDTAYVVRGECRIHRQQ
jgi:hypothetical protein